MVPLSCFSPWLRRLAGVCLLLSCPASAEDTLDRTLDASTAALQSGARSQDRVAALDDETARLLTQWRDTRRRSEELRQFVTQLESQTTAQSEQLEHLRSSMGEIATLERQIVPLMLEMAATLRRFVDLDLPFMREERLERLDRVDAALARPDLDNGEKFRRLMEAWSVEAGYGETLEAWSGEIGSGAEALQVEFLRVGRVMLCYRALDGRSGAVWNPATAAWQALDTEQLPELHKAMQVARDERAPGLLMLPVPAPTGAER